MDIRIARNFRDGVEDARPAKRPVGKLFYLGVISSVPEKVLGDHITGIQRSGELPMENAVSGFRRGGRIPLSIAFLETKKSPTATDYNISVAYTTFLKTASLCSGELPN